MTGAENLLASAVEINITPPVGGPMEGYSARSGVSQGIHDPLMAKLLLLSAGSQQVALMSLDLVGVNQAFTALVRSGIQRAVGVPAGSVLIACSHTHSGEAGFLSPLPGIAMPANVERQNVVAQQLIEAAIWAKQKLQPARLGCQRGWVEGLGLNRNDPGKAMDQEVTVLRVDSIAGQPLAVMFNYGCHPTVMGYQNLQLSADFPGAVCATLQRIYPDTVFLFTNGASGDVSTRFTRREQSFDEVQRLGRLLGGEVLKVMQGIQTRPITHLHSLLTRVDLPYRILPAPAEADRNLACLEAELESLQVTGVSPSELRKAVTRLEGAKGQVLMSKELGDVRGVMSEIQVMEIGDLALVALPGEAFTQTVLEIKRAAPSTNTAVISYANDYQGYFPDAASIAEGSYEALISPFGAEAADLLRDKAVEILSRR